MPFISTLGCKRRDILKAAAVCAVAPLSVISAMAAGRPGASAGLTTTLRSGPARVRMGGESYPATGGWTYDGDVPGPVLRIRQGMPFHATVENRLARILPCIGTASACRTQWTG